ncbi:MAG: SPASM domain-containing protein [Erysipelotrichales bacterium]|nr:SPASM domain-containing protein [Erysipelotrichales bacterium]
MNIQIQTTSACSGKCIICPYGDSWHKKHPGRMTDAVFGRILDQLAGRRLGKICAYLENEPLLDPDIFDRIQAVKERLRFDSLEFSTNAQSLDAAAADRLAGLFQDVRHEIWVSFHGVDKRTHEGVMGLDYERCLENTIGLLKLADTLPLRVIIRGAGLPLHPDLAHDFQFDEQAYTKFWEGQLRRHGIRKRPGINWIRFHDRAGAIRRTPIRLKAPVRPDLAGFSCPRLDRWLHFLYTGELILCCMDYHRETVFGDVTVQDLDAILAGPAYGGLRAKVTGEAASSPDFICKRCISPGG